MSAYAWTIGAGVFMSGLLLARSLWQLQLPDEDAPLTDGLLNPAVRAPERAPRLGPLGRLAKPDQPGAYEALGQWLVQAGYWGIFARERYLALRAGLTIVAPAAALLIPGLGVMSRVTLALLLAFIGYVAPRVWVGTRRRLRQRELSRSLPNMLDMLVSCLEAGLSLDASLARVAEETDDGAPLLASHLRRLDARVNAGTPRQEALKRFHEDTGLQEIAALIGVLSQAERFGVGIASSLRAHARVTRQARMYHAERRSAEVVPLLTVAMVTLILPSLFVVLIGPTIVIASDAWTFWQLWGR